MFSVIVVFGVIMVWVIYHPPQFENKALNPVIALSYRNIPLTPENAPQLSDLLSHKKDGPHQSFSSAENCLVCHSQSIEIPSVGKTPIIQHDPRPNCMVCHKLLAN